MNLRFDQAAIAIFVAMVLDGLDGRVARLTHTQSAFGAEYDSLSDMVSFGAAPALVDVRVGAAATWASWAGSRRSSTVAGAALRLARFNTMLEVADKRWFTGHAEPGGGGAGRGLRVDHRRLRHDREPMRWWAWCVTRVRRSHDGEQPQVLQLQDDQPEEERAVPRDLLVFVLVIALLSYQPPLVLFAGFVAYALSGYVASGVEVDGVRRRRSAAPPI